MTCKNCLDLTARLDKIEAKLDKCNKYGNDILYATTVISNTTKETRKLVNDTLYAANVISSTTKENRKFNNDILYGSNRANKKLDKIQRDLSFVKLTDLVAGLLNLLSEINLMQRLEELRKFNNDILYGANRANERLIELRKFNNDILYGANRANEKLDKIIGSLNFSGLTEMVSGILEIVDSVGFKARFEELRKFNNDILYGSNRANEKLDKIIGSLNFSNLVDLILDLSKLIQGIDVNSKLAAIDKKLDQILERINFSFSGLIEMVSGLLATFNSIGINNKLDELRKFNNDILYVVNSISRKLDFNNGILEAVQAIQEDLKSTNFSVTEWRYKFEALPEQSTVQLSCPKKFQGFFSWLGRRNEDISKILCEFQHKVGVDELRDSTLPASLIQMREQEASAEISIPSLVRLQAWQFERFDEVFGQWSIPIQIDGEVDGNSTSEIIELPNLAEAIGEIYSLLLNDAANSEKILNLSVKSLVETGEIRVNAAKNFFAINAILNCLGANLKETSESIPLSFKINANSIEELLGDGSTVKASMIVYPDKEPTIRENLHDLLHSAAIIRAVYWRKIDLKDAVGAAGQIANIIKQYKQTKDKVENDDEDWSEFVANTELGYTNQVNISDSTRPYGRKYEERPRIKKLGD